MPRKGPLLRQSSWTRPFGSWNASAKDKANNPNKRSAKSKTLQRSQSHQIPDSPTVQTKEWASLVAEHDMGDKKVRKLVVLM